MLDEDSQNLKDEIITSMAQVEDKHHRIVLSLMIRMMNTQENFTNVVFEKLDTLIRDEERIKEIVLNGHTEQHIKHHDWVQEQLNNNRSLKQWFFTHLGKALFMLFIFSVGYVANQLLPNLFGG